ncbi:MAG TPA: hypothetical protein VN764_01220 [Polyangiaceae bacterium]|nr:hypothetical protein [Polyangiaceae bacterium]
MIWTRTLLYGALALHLAACDRTQPREPDSSSGSSASEGTGAVGGSPSAAPGEPELLYDLTALGRPVAIHYHDRQLYFGVMTNAAYEFYQAPADGKGAPRKLGESTAPDAGVLGSVISATSEYVFWVDGVQLARYDRRAKTSTLFSVGIDSNELDVRIGFLEPNSILAATMNCESISIVNAQSMGHGMVTINQAVSEQASTRLLAFGTQIYCATRHSLLAFPTNAGGQGEVEFLQADEAYSFSDLAVFSDQLYTVRSALRKNAIVERLDRGALAHVATLDGAYQSCLVADEQRGVFFLADITGWEHPIYKVDVATGTVRELVGSAQPAKRVEADESYLYWTTDNYVVPKEHLRSGIYRQSKDAPTR